MMGKDPTFSSSHLNDCLKMIWIRIKEKCSDRLLMRLSLLQTMTWKIALPQDIQREPYHWSWPVVVHRDKADRCIKIVNFQVFQWWRGRRHIAYISEDTRVSMQCPWVLINERRNYVVWNWSQFLVAISCILSKIDVIWIVPFVFCCKRTAVTRLRDIETSCWRGANTAWFSMAALVYSYI